MKNFVQKTAVALFMSVSLSLSVTASAAPEKFDSRFAIGAALEWLEDVDKGQYNKSWNGLAASFQARWERKDWKAQLETIRDPLGLLVSRTLVSETRSPASGDLPEGKYIVYQFDTLLLSRVTETVVMTIDKDAKWRVANYTLKQAGS